jgi:hypothetical protein
MLLTNMIMDNRLFKLAVILVLVMGFGWLLTSPINYHETESTRTQFETKYVDNNQIELGKQTITTHGSNGTTETTYDYKTSLLGWLFDKNNQRGQGKISTKVIVEPVAQEVQKGTLKYQYMWCSNGTYRYYTNEQFANPQTGFTNSSPDYCRESGQGYKEKLASAQGPRCRDVTTYDYNWNNDMLCTNIDGSTFYTSYGGASAFLKN